MEYAQKRVSPLLAQILAQMQDQQQFRPQSYGALAAGLGAQALNQSSLNRAMAQEQAQRQAQQRALVEALGTFQRQSTDYPETPLPPGSTPIAGGNTWPGVEGDPEMARGNLLQSLSGIDNPLAQGGAQAILAQMLSPQKQDLINVQPGGTVFDPSSRKPVFTADRAPEWKLGQTRDFKVGKETVTQEVAGFGPDGAPLWKELGRGQGGPLAEIYTGDLTKETTNTLQADVLKAERRLANLYDLRQRFRPNFLTYKGKATMSLAALAEKADIASEDQRKYLSEYSTWAQGAAQELNQYIKDVTGATVGQGNEEERLRKGIPDYQKDSPTEFLSKLDKTITDLQFATARTKYLLSKGLKADSMTIDEFKRALAERAAELEVKYRKDFSNLTEKEIQALALNVANREFMR